MTVTTATVADSSSAVTSSKGHVAVWNGFVDDVLALHKKQLTRYKVTTSRKPGGYFNDPEFYIEERFTDSATGNVLSVIQWEKAHPDRVHSIDVYVRDDKGRVIRDYSALYLTFSRNAPQQTLINLHAHNGKLHGWRQFDASDERIQEQCKGELNGKPVMIELDDMDLLGATDRLNRISNSPEYKACFEGLPENSAGKYLTPQ